MPRLLIEYVRCRDAVFFHHRQRAIDAAPGGDTEGDTAAIFPDGGDETLQRRQITDKVLIEVGEDGTITVAQRPWRRFTRDGLILAGELTDLRQVALGMGLPGIKRRHTFNTVARGQRPGLVIAQ